MEGVEAKFTSNGRIRLQPILPIIFRKIQETLRNLKVIFHSFPFLENRNLKVIRGIPTDISEEEIKYELEHLGLTLQL